MKEPSASWPFTSLFHRERVGVRGAKPINSTGLPLPYPSPGGRGQEKSDAFLTPTSHWLAMIGGWEARTIRRSSHGCKSGGAGDHPWQPVLDDQGDGVAHGTLRSVAVH